EHLAAARVLADDRGHDVLAEVPRVAVGQDACPGHGVGFARLGDVRRLFHQGERFELLLGRLLGRASGEADRPECEEADGSATRDHFAVITRSWARPASDTRRACQLFSFGSGPLFSYRARTTRFSSQ